MGCLLAPACSVFCLGRFAGSEVTEGRDGGLRESLEDLLVELVVCV